MEVESFIFVFVMLNSLNLILYPELLNYSLITLVDAEEKPAYEMNLYILSVTETISATGFTSIKMFFPL